jgi:hypothetical protein
VSPTLNPQVTRLSKPRLREVVLRVGSCQDSKAKQIE